jgi:uncharacterized pyridoxal phosphate-containing UPF0001 family protein
MTAALAVTGCTKQLADPQPSFDRAGRLAITSDVRSSDHSVWPVVTVMSVGHEHDFEVAIVCGAPHVQVGRAIFGSRV